MISFERKRELLTDFSNALGVIRWMERKGLIDETSGSYEEDLMRLAVSFCVVSNQEKIWLANQVPFKVTDEEKDDFLISQLLGQMHQYTILIQGVYEPKVYLRTNPDLTGQLVSEEYEEPYALLEFSSYEDAVQKLKEFYESYSVPPAPETNSIYSGELVNKESMYFHYGLPIVSVREARYAVATSKDAAIKAALEVAVEEIETYDKDFIEFCLRQGIGSLDLSKLSTLTVAELFACNAIAEDGNNLAVFLSPYDEKQLSLSNFSKEEQAIILSAVPGAQYLYRV